MSDAEARDGAMLDTARTVVLRASAGTGKTTVLVERLCTLLLRDGLAAEKIVAITFTEDAASSMKSRLRRKLQDAFRWSLGEKVEAPRCAAECDTGTLGRRAAEAIEQLDRAVIETIHAFAARLLKTFPEEAGVDASFTVEDDVALAESLERDWAAWSREELAQGAPRHDRWRKVLRVLPWEPLRELAFRLADFEDVPDDPGAIPAEARTLHEGQIELLEELMGKVKKEMACTEEAQAALEVLKRARDGGWKPLDDEAPELGSFPAKPTLTCGWEPEEFECARAAHRAAGAWARTRSEAVEAVRLLRGFADFHREASLRHARLSFQGLLVLARDLLRSHPRLVRRFAEHRFLVDEFQDTDEKQAEIVLRLASPAAKPGADWRSLRPDAGRLFVVGDPKQSIYAWRGADLGVHDAVCAQLVAAGARDLLLTRNFRCQPAVVQAANAIFGQAFAEERGIQAPHAPLEAARPELKLGGRCVEQRSAKVAGDDGAPELARHEARAIADWIARLRGDTARRIEVEVPDTPGKPTDVLPPRLRDIAILVRQTTHLPEYLRALREFRIPYVVTREQHFYETQEVRDAINLLLALVRPDDALSLTGVLRSPVGGLTFDEIHALATPDYRRKAEGRAELLFAKLRDLRKTALSMPVPEAVDLILDRSGLREAAAAAAHGEQALANLEKIAALAAKWAAPELTLREFADRLGRKLRDPEREAESPLGEPDDEVVRVSTIHGAKGLEWPVVIVAGLHAPKRDGREPGAVASDSAGFAARVGADAVTPAWAYLEERRKRRGEAETVRLFYVACTRAREALVLSRAGDKKGPFLDLLADGVVPDRPCEIPPVPRPASAQPLPFAADAELERWRARREEFDAAMGRAALVSPSALMHREDEGEPEAPHAWSSPAARDAGTMVHAVLEKWDFAGDDLDRALARAGSRLRPAERAAALPRARALLEAFLRSPECAEIASSKILGREVPFVMPLQDGRTIAGVIDLLLERDGRLEIRDYKTGHEDPRYEIQQQIYLGAVKKLLPGREASFRFVYLGGKA